MYRSLLVGLTPGGVSDAPARYAIGFAQRAHLRLQGVTVIDPDRLTPGEPVSLGGDAYKARRDQEMLAKVRQAANETLAKFRDEGKSADVPCETAMHEGDLPVMLAAAAERADALVVGHGTGRSVAGEVAHLHVLHGILTHCARPLIVAVPRGRPGETALVAYDGSVHASHALQAFATSGWYATYEVHVLTIHADPAVGEQVAQRAIDYLRGHEIAAKRRLETPHPDTGQQILEWVRQTQAGLLVMGTHGHSRLREFFLGSTTHTVLDASEVSVLLAH